MNRFWTRHDAPNLSTRQVNQILADRESVQRFTEQGLLPDLIRANRGEQVKLVNLTPHPIVIFAPKADYRSTPLMTVPPSGEVARIVSIDLGWTTWTDDDSDLFRVTHQEYGRINGLPSPADGVQYVVSLVVALAARGRADLLAPYGEVRNGEGTMVGCYALQRIC